IVHRRITNDGALLTAEGRSLVLYRKDEVRQYPITEPLYGDPTLMIDDSGTRALFVTASQKLVSYDLTSGKETILAASVPPLPASMSGDGAEILFLNRVDGKLQAFLTRSDGTGLRQITNVEDGLTTTTISGNGQVIFAATAA